MSEELITKTFIHSSSTTINWIDCLFSLFSFLLFAVRGGGISSLFFFSFPSTRSLLFQGGLDGSESTTKGKYFCWRQQTILWSTFAVSPFLFWSSVFFSAFPPSTSTSPTTTSPKFRLRLGFFFFSFFSLYYEICLYVYDILLFRWFFISYSCRHLRRKKFALTRLSAREDSKKKTSKINKGNFWYYL